jgi:hypothetical protein
MIDLPFLFRMLQLDIELVGDLADRRYGRAFAHPNFV